MHACIYRSSVAYILFMYISCVDHSIRINEYQHIHVYIMVTYHLQIRISSDAAVSQLQKVATWTHSGCLSQCLIRHQWSVLFLGLSIMSIFLCAYGLFLSFPNMSMLGVLLLWAHEDTEGSILVNSARAHPAKCIWSMPTLFFFLLFCGQTPWVHLWHTRALGGIKEYIIIHNRWVL